MSNPQTTNAQYRYDRADSGWVRYNVNHDDRHHCRDDKDESDGVRNYSAQLGLVGSEHAYNPECSWCWLGYSHTLNVHTPR